MFREARRSTPSIIYIPHIDSWWQVLSDTMKATFLLMISDLDPLSPILLLATSDSSATQLPPEVMLANNVQHTDVLMFPGFTAIFIYHLKSVTGYKISIYSIILASQFVLPV